MSEKMRLNVLALQTPEVQVISSTNLIEIPINQNDDQINANDSIYLIQNDEKKSKKLCYASNSLPGTSFNFINSIIGSGVIGMPFAFNQAGIGMSFLLLILVALLTDYSILTLISSGNLAGVKTYQDLVYISMGRYGYVLLIIVQFLYPFISLISYNIIIGDTITKVLSRMFNLSTKSIFSNRNFIIFICSICVTLILSLYRNISKLAKTSLLSVVFLLFIFMVMIIKYFELKDKIIPTNDAWTFSKNFNGILDSFSIMAFGFMCHHNSFLIYYSMNEVNIKNWKKVTHSSVIVSIIFSALFGLIGYITFTGYTQGDIFENYCHNDDVMNVVRFIYATIIMFTYPLECFVCRDVIENTFFSKYKGNLAMHVIITLFIVLITVLLSLITDCLGIVLELNGSLIATILAYVMPALCTILINKRYKDDKKGLIIPVIVCLFGLFVAIYGLISIIIKLINGTSCLHGEEPVYCRQYDKFFTNAFSNSTIFNNYSNSTFL